MARMFGTDGVRGVAGSELTIELATNSCFGECGQPGSGCHGGDIGEGHLQGLFSCRSRDQRKRY